jgi:hypothetical protein
LNVYAKRCATQAGIDLGGLPSIGALCSPRKSFNFRQQTLEPTEVSFNYFCRLPRRSRSTEVEVPYGSVLNSCCVCCFSTLISSVERVEQKWSLTFSPHPWIPPQLQSSPLFATGVSTTCYQRAPTRGYLRRGLWLQFTSTRSGSPGSQSSYLNLARKILDYTDIN